MELVKLHQRNLCSFGVARIRHVVASTELFRVAVDVTRKALTPRAELGFFIMRPLCWGRHAERSDRRSGLCRDSRCVGQCE